MLFGHQSNDDTTGTIPDNVINEAVAAVPIVNPLATDQDTGAALPATADDNSLPTPDNTVFSGQPVQPASDTTTPSNDVTVPEPQELSGPDTIAPEAPTDATPATSDDLLALKQQALGQLTPLVDHLDQSPEEKFRTTMMMIQSTDNQSLLKDAYAAAQAITDDKVRAQALLDVINEINYFTQQK